MIFVLDIRSLSLSFCNFDKMNSKELDKEKLMNYWIEGSDDDFDTMMAMFTSKKYNWSLFIGHLMIEKLLKAYYIKKMSDYPPYIHNLLRLAEKADLIVNDDIKEQLVTITAFNINARYDDYKMSFKKLCTPEYTLEWVIKLKELRVWMKNLIV